MAEHAVLTRVSVVVSIMSPVLKGEPRTVPYQVYGYLVHECNMMYGLNMELRRLVESMAGGAVRRAAVPAPATNACMRIRSLIKIATRCMEVLSSTSREDKDPKRMTRFVKWLIMELRALGNHSG